MKEKKSVPIDTVDLLLLEMQRKQPSNSGTACVRHIILLNKGRPHKKKISTGCDRLR